jgi:HD superfamily phosphohydrolase YqeK
VLSGGKQIFNATSNIFTYLPQLIIFCLIYFIINTIIIAALFSCLSNKNFLFVFTNEMRLVLISNLAMAPFGLIIAYLYTNSIMGVFMFLCPVMLAKFTFSLYAETKEKYVQTINVLTRAMEVRDKYTEGHSQRVADIVDSIAKTMKYSDWKREQLKIAALMHDVGKIGIDDAILKKPGRLTDEEYEAIKRHPVIGYNILKDVKDLESVLDLVKYHHERYDGKGYPDGKAAGELSMDVFIIQLADSIDAMATDRPYRKALSEDNIISEIMNCSGTQFHPKVVEAYLKTKGIDMQSLIKEKAEAERKGDTLCSLKQ